MKAIGGSLTPVGGCFLCVTVAGHSVDVWGRQGSSRPPLLCISLFVFVDAAFWSVKVGILSDCPLAMPSLSSPLSFRVFPPCPQAQIYIVAVKDIWEVPSSVFSFDVPVNFLKCLWPWLQAQHIFYVTLALPAVGVMVATIVGLTYFQVQARRTCHSHRELQAVFFQWTGFFSSCQKTYAIGHSVTAVGSPSTVVGYPPTAVGCPMVCLNTELLIGRSEFVCQF